MATLLRDIRYASRLLLKSPGFSIVAMLTLAIGIGANTTVFTWVDGILLRPLPGVADGDRLVALENVAPDGEPLTSSFEDFRDFRDHSRLLSGVALVRPTGVSIGDERSVERVWAELVSGNFFAVLGVKPAAGRMFSPEEYGDKFGGYPVAVISYRLWQNRFGGDPGIVGRTIRVNRRELTVVGVADREFRGSMAMLAFDLWMPAVMQSVLTGASDGRLTDRKTRDWKVVARLAPGATVAQASSEAAGIARELGARFPQTNGSVGATVLPLWKSHFGAQQILAGPLQILMAVCGVVLLIVCSNVANLLLARSTVRKKEFAIRLAMGAGRWRLLRQLLTESAMLAAGGAALGLLLTYWLADAMKFLVPTTSFPISANSLRLDGTMLGFTALLALITAVVFGAAPALQSMKPRVQETLKDGGRSDSGAAGSHRIRGLLVVSQLALAMVALIGAGLFAKSFKIAGAINPGFDPANVAIAKFDLSDSRYTREQGVQFYRRLKERLETQPGVEAVTYAEKVPLGFDGGSWEDLEIEGYVPGLSENMKIWRNVVAPGYFSAMKIPLVDGRDFTDSDDEKSLPVMVINQEFARRFLPDQNPIGRKVRGWGRWFTIVGIAKDSKYQKLAENQLPYFYVPFRQLYRADMAIAAHVRTRDGAVNGVAALRREARALDPGVSTFDTMPLTTYMEASLFGQKTAAMLLGVLGSVALLLAAVGLYGVIAYSITQRTHEIGIRMALGARPADVRGMVVRQGVVLAAGGVAAGAAVALGVTRLVSGALLKVSPRDPAVYLGAAAFLAAVAVVASYLPARRATRVDPIIALRCQ